MPGKGIVTGQRVDPTKLERAKTFRRDMTPPEAVLWQQLRRGRLNGLHFRRQQVVGGFIVDFYCHAAGVVVELDGDIHRRQRAYDRERDEVLRERGLRVLRVRNEEVSANLSGVLARILAECT